MAAPSVMHDKGITTMKGAFTKTSLKASIPRFYSTIASMQSPCCLMLWVPFELFLACATITPDTSHDSWEKNYLTSNVQIYTKLV